MTENQERVGEAREVEDAGPFLGSRLPGVESPRVLGDTPTRITAEGGELEIVAEGAVVCVLVNTPAARFAIELEWAGLADALVRDLLKARSAVFGEPVEDAELRRDAEDAARLRLLRAEIYALFDEYKDRIGGEGELIKWRLARILGRTVP